MKKQKMRTVSYSKKKKNKKGERKRRNGTQTMTQQKDQKILTAVSERLHFSLNSGSRLPNVARKCPQRRCTKEKLPPLRNHSQILDTRVIKGTFDSTFACFGSKSSGKGYSSPKSTKGRDLKSAS